MLDKQTIEKLTPMMQHFVETKEKYKELNNFIDEKIQQLASNAENIENKQLEQPQTDEESEAE